MTTQATGSPSFDDDGDGRGEDFHAQTKAKTTYTSQQLRQCANDDSGVDDDDDALTSSRFGHSERSAPAADPSSPSTSHRQESSQSQQKQHPQPQLPPMINPRNRVSLVRLPSGKRIWWMDHGISSRRTEVMLRRRMQFLKEENEKNIAAAAVARGEGENGAAAIEQFAIGSALDSATIDNVVEDVNSPSFERRQQQQRAKKQQSAALHEISLEEEEDRLSKIDTNFNYLKSPRRHAERNNNIPIVKLFPSNYYHDAKTDDENKSRTYLDFGEEDNVVGSTMWRSFLVATPSPSDSSNSNKNNDDPDGTIGCDNEDAEFHVTFRRWIPEKGIMCSINDETIGNSSSINEGITVDNRKRGDTNNAILSNNNVALSDRPIHFSLKGGEVKIVHVSWSPSQREDGDCVIRESMDLEVMTATTLTEEEDNDDRSKVCWQRHSIVIVGEAKATSDEDKDDNEDESCAVQDLTGDSNKFIEGGGMMMMSTITNSTEEFNLQRGRRSIATNLSEGEEREEEEPEAIDSIMEQSWNNLSEIQEVDDQDDGTDDGEDDDDGEDCETMQYRSLEIDGDASLLVVGPLDSIGEAGNGTPVGSTTSSTNSSTSSSDSDSSCSESSEMSVLEELAEMLQQLHVIKSPPEESRDQMEGWATIVGRGGDAAEGTERSETTSTSTGQRKQRAFAEEEASTSYEQRPVADSNVRGNQMEHAEGREHTARASLQQSPQTEEGATVPHEQRKAASHDSPGKQAQHSSTRKETAKSCVQIEDIEKGNFSEKGGESSTSADGNNGVGGSEELGEEMSVSSEENSEMSHNRSDAVSSRATEEKLQENHEVGAAFMCDQGEDAAEGTDRGETLTTETAQQQQLSSSEEGSPTLCNHSKTIERIGRSRHAEYAVMREETAKVIMQLEDMEEELFSEKGEESTALAGSKNGGCGLEESGEIIWVSSVEIAEMSHHRSDAVHTPSREDKPHDEEGGSALIGDHGEDAVGGIERNETVATKTAQQKELPSSEESAPTLHDHQIAADHTGQRRHAEYAVMREETAKVSIQLQILEKEHFLEEKEEVEEESMYAISRERSEIISGSSGVISEMLSQSDAVPSPARQEKPQDQQEECSGTLVADRGEHSHSIEGTVQQNQPTMEVTTLSYNEEGTKEHKDTANFNSRRQTDVEKESEASIVEYNTNEEPEQAVTVASPAGNKWRETVAVSLLEDMEMEHTQTEGERARKKEAAVTQQNKRQMRDKNDVLEELFASKGLVVDASMKEEPNPSANGNDDDETRGRRRSVRFVTDGLYHDDEKDSVSHQICVEKDGRPHDNMGPTPKDTSAPSCGTLSSEDSIIGNYAHIRHDLPMADDPPSALAGSISRCLAEVDSPEGKYLDVSSFNEYLAGVHDSNLVNGDDSLEDEDLERQGILSHLSRHVDEDEEYIGLDFEQDNLEIDLSELNPNEEIIFTKMMERATSEDEDRYPPSKSFDSLHDLEHDKSELNAFIDSVSKIQQVTHFQHDYIMSPTEDDFYTQLDHLNDQIDQIPDGITPHSYAKRKSLSSVSDDPPQVDSFTETISLPGEKKDCLAKNDKISSHGQSNENHAPTARMREGEEEIEKKKPTRSKPKKKNGTTNLSSTTILGFKTPSPHHRFKGSVASSARSEQLQVLVENAYGDDSKQRTDSVVGSFDLTKGPGVTERRQQPQFTPTNKPKEKGNTTKAAARKCYFFKSPRQRANRIMRSSSQPSSNTNNNIRNKPSSPSENHNSSKERDVKKGIKVKYYTPTSFRPREMKAIKKHIVSIREHTNNEDSSPKNDQKGGKGRSTTPQLLNTAGLTSRESKAIETHIRSVRKRDQL